MRYKVVFAGEYWRILDTKIYLPTMAYFHVKLPDAENEAKALAGKLNSEPK